MQKVVHVLESKVVVKNSTEYQRVIFSDDKIVYVDVETGDVKPDSTPDRYVDLISVYNSTHRHNHTVQNSNVQHEPNSLRTAAAVIDVILVFIVGWLGIIALFNGGFLIVLLAWMIPMTVMTTHSVTDGKERVGLGVCHIIFFNIISGILILVSNGQIREQRAARYARH